MRLRNLLALTPSFALLVACQARGPQLAEAGPVTVTPPAPQVAPPPPAPLELDVRVARIEQKKTFTATLSEMGLSDDQVGPAMAALKAVFDFRKLRVGDQLRLTTSAGRFESLEVTRSPVQEWIVERDGDSFVGRKREVEVEKKVATVNIRVDSSLYEAMLEAGEDQSLAVEAADVFAWDIDFFRDVRKGDRVRIVVEKYIAHGHLLKYGEILGIRYEGSSVGSKRLLRYTPEGSTVSYFDEKGTSAKKSFLKSPLKFVHITSGFGGRINPLSGYQQNHAGVDFAAAVGTPVWAVADGVVTTMVRNDPGGGNFVFLRHMNGLETGYLHLSKFADGLHVGARVTQKQVIAYSGNTGMSTGPHLHYAMKRGGGYINPLTQRFPRAEPLPQTELSRFEQETAEIREKLDAEMLAQL